MCPPLAALASSFQTAFGAMTAFQKASTALSALSLGTSVKSSQDAKKRAKKGAKQSEELATSDFDRSFKRGGAVQGSGRTAPGRRGLRIPRY
jgi:hypothetical protein